MCLHQSPPYLDGESRQNQGHEVEKYIIRLMLKENWALMPIRRLSASHIAEYRDRRLRSIKPSSFNRQFSVLKVACAVARDEWLWEFDDRFLKIRRARVNAIKIPRRVSKDEFQRINSGEAFEKGYTDYLGGVPTFYLFRFNSGKSKKKSPVINANKKSIFTGSVSDVTFSQNKPNPQIYVWILIVVLLAGISITLSSRSVTDDLGITTPKKAVKKP